MVYQKLRNGVPAGPFQFDHQFMGIRNFGSTGKYDQSEAEVVEAKKMAIFKQKVEERKRTEAEAQAETAARVRSPVLTVADLAERYKPHLFMQGFAAAVPMSRDVDRLVSMLGPDTALTSIDNDMLQKLILEAKGLKRNKKNGCEDKIKNITINASCLGRLRAMLQFAKNIHKVLLPYEPDWRAFILNEDKIRIRYLSFSESNKLDVVVLQHFPDYYPIDKFARLSALRLANLVELTWDNVDWDKREISVITKGGFPHCVPITQEIEDLLRPLIGHHPTRVFTVKAKISRRSRGDCTPRVAGLRYPIGREMYKLISREMFKLAGINGYCIHGHRHTAATWMYAKTKDLVAVQMLLGHRTIVMARRYAKLELSALRAAMEAVSAERNRHQVQLKSEMRERTPDEVVPVF